MIIQRSFLAFALLVPYCLATIAMVRRHAAGPGSSEQMRNGIGAGALAPSFATLRATNQCPTIAFSDSAFTAFEKTDAEYPGKGFELAQVQALDGSACQSETSDGVAMDGRGRCIDFGVSSLEETARRHPTDFKVQEALEEPDQSFPLEFFPSARQASSPVPDAPRELAAKLQRKLEAQQFSSDHGCGLASAPAWRASYYVNTVPKVGFGSVIEYAMMFLGRATHMGSQLALGQRSSSAWTSTWACGRERSLSCYFNVSSCCGHLSLRGQPLELPRRRNPLNLGLPGFNQYGAMWVAGQMAHFFFGRFTPATRSQIDQRRSSVWPRGGLRQADGTPQQCIGMHIRGGDSCHAGRYCASNLTDTFFAQAARMRERYGVNTIVLATDSTKAAKLCRSRPLGFACRTMAINDRDKFESATYIEERVAQHATGPLSGSAVALDALADLDMLADCDYHVLVLRSAMSRLAYVLSLARHGRPTPLVSLQWPYSAGSMKRMLQSSLNKRARAYL